MVILWSNNLLNQYEIKYLLYFSINFLCRHEANQGSSDDIFEN